MFGTTSRIKLVAGPVLLAVLGLYPSSASADLSLVQTIQLRIQIDATINFLVAENELAVSRLAVLEVVALVDPSVDGVITNLKNVIANNLASLNRLVQERAIVVALENAQIQLQLLEIQRASADRRGERIAHRFFQGPFARFRLRRLGSIVQFDDNAIRSVRAEINRLQRQLATFLSGG
jgi:hypothetical protein